MRAEPERAGEGLWRPVRGGSARLLALDSGGDGPPALLLHGLAGSAREWSETAAWLRATRRVVALDQRGHGRSERFPPDLSREAFVADALVAIEELEPGPVTLIGQSLGGLTALLVAAHRPELVRMLVVAEASPGETAPETPGEIREALTRWPVPFSSLDEARAFFGGNTVAGDAWARGLERREDGWWPSFDLEVLVAALSESVGVSYWKEWERIRAPTLVVRGEQGMIPDSEAEEMVRRLPSAQLVSLAGAGHDVHLEAPAAWRRAVERFLQAPTRSRRRG